MHVLSAYIFSPPTAPSSVDCCDPHMRTWRTRRGPRERGIAETGKKKQKEEEARWGTIAEEGEGNINTPAFKYVTENSGGGHLFINSFTN